MRRLILIRTIIVVMFVPFFTWTLIRRIWIEMRSIPVYVLADWSEDWDAGLDAWRTGNIGDDEGDGW